MGKCSITGVWNVCWLRKQHVISSTPGIQSTDLLQRTLGLSDGLSVTLFSACAALSRKPLCQKAASTSAPRAEAGERSKLTISLLIPKPQLIKRHACCWVHRRAAPAVTHICNIDLEFLVSKQPHQHRRRHKSHNVMLRQLNIQALA